MRYCRRLFCGACTRHEPCASRIRSGSSHVWCNHRKNERLRYFVQHPQDEEGQESQRLLHHARGDVEKSQSKQRCGGTVRPQHVTAVITHDAVHSPPHARVFRFWFLLSGIHPHAPTKPNALPFREYKDAIPPEIGTRYRRRELDLLHGIPFSASLGFVLCSGNIVVGWQNEIPMT